VRPRDPLLLCLLRALLTSVADLLGPPCCASCDERLRRSAVFCAPCARTVARADPAGAEREPPALAFAAFGGAVAVALRRLKYEDRPDLARPLGELLRLLARERGVAAEVVVPVPLHPRRLVERGYNQAALLAWPVAAELGARFCAGALHRVRHTPQQALLDRAARLTNLDRAFEVKAPGALRGRRVLLVDDVATTGSTLAACRAEVLKAGALSVEAMVVARA
jgi:ComF family protein